jgi:hypothetical protein
MKFPPGPVTAISVFFGEAHQCNFSERGKSEALTFISESKNKGVVAIVWYRDERPVKLYQSGRWSDYKGPVKAPKFNKGPKPLGRGTNRYIAARLEAIVTALGKANEHQLTAIGRILAIESIQ